jgi:hypothetical protein
LTTSWDALSKCANFRTFFLKDLAALEQMFLINPLHERIYIFNFFVGCKVTKNHLKKKKLVRTSHKPGAKSHFGVKPLVELMKGGKKQTSTTSHITNYFTQCTASISKRTKLKKKSYKQPAK